MSTCDKIVRLLLRTDDLTQKQISARLGIPLNTVWKVMQGLIATKQVVFEWGESPEGNRSKLYSLSSEDGDGGQEV